MCFLFLRGLKQEFQVWAGKLCATNNVAGFGTGPRLGFVEVSRRAVEFEREWEGGAGRRGGGGSGSGRR